MQVLYNKFHAALVGVEHWQMATLHRKQQKIILIKEFQLQFHFVCNKYCYGPIGQNK